MSEPARRRMTIDEFLDWDDRSGLAHELVDGVPVAMAPPVINHQRVALNIARVIDDAVSGRPSCRALVGAGVVIPDRARANAWVPDVVMSCEPIDERKLLEAPSIIVEVLSPGTAAFDEQDKLEGYMRIASVEEIWLVRAQRRSAFVFQRDGQDWRSRIFIGRAAFPSRVLARDVPLDELYALTPLAEDEDER